MKKDGLIIEIFGEISKEAEKIKKDREKNMIVRRGHREQVH